MNNPQSPQNSPLHYFPVHHHELIIGETPISQLANPICSTPFYVYDKNLINERIKQLRVHFPKDISLRYSMRANPMPELVSHLSSLIDGFDATSIKEIKIALDTGIPPEQISFSGPGKTDEEILFAMSAGVIINLESLRQLHLVMAIKSILDVKAKVAVLANPDFDFKSSKLRMESGAKQFGVDSELVPGFITKIKDAEISFEGLHIFNCPQNLNTESAIETLNKSFDLAFQLKENSDLPVNFLSINGGFGIPYFPGDQPLDLAAIGKALTDKMLQIRKFLPGTKLSIELGRYIVGESGVYVCRVIDRKISRGQVFLVTDGGINHRPAAKENLGQMARKNYPIAVANKMDMEPTEIVTIVGPLCTPDDILGDKVFLPRAEIGDLIAIFQSGAYGLTASPSDFMGHTRPLEIFI